MMQYRLLDYLLKQYLDLGKLLLPSCQHHTQNFVLHPLEFPEAPGGNI